MVNEAMAEDVLLVVVVVAAICIMLAASVWACVRLYRVSLEALDTHKQNIDAELVRDHSITPERFARLKRATDKRVEQRREEEAQRRVELAQLVLLQRVARSVPGALFVVGEKDGDLVLQIAGGETLVDAGYDPQDLIGMSLKDVGGTDSRLEGFYRRALEGERHTQILEGGYETRFVPLVFPDDPTPRALATSRLLKEHAE